MIILYILIGLFWAVYSFETQNYKYNKNDIKVYGIYYLNVIAWPIMAIKCFKQKKEKENA